MELDRDKEVGKLQAEIEQLVQQLQQVEQNRNNLSAVILRKQGALELLQGLEEKPKDEKQV